MSEGLMIENRFADSDAAFRLLVEAHRGLSEAESAALNARLVLLLANHVGEAGVLEEAIRLALKAASRLPETPATE
jgi:hypothetical protein